MPTCPLCENVQPAGDACEACGRAFSREAAVPVPVAPLDGLEATSLVDGALPPPDAPTQPVEGLEQNSAAPVAVEVEAMPGLEPTFAAPVPGDGEPGLPAATCRYCLTRSTGIEVFCGRCGMRLPARDVGRASEPAGHDAGSCHSCGTRMSGTLCPECGARAPG